MRYFLLFIVSVCLMTTGIASPKENVVYVDGDTRKAVFHLPENPTTGFRWYLVSAPNRLIEQIVYDYEAPFPSMPGQPGMASFIVTVSPEAMLAPRIIPVLIKSARAWEPAVGQEQTLWVVISI